MTADRNPEAARNSRERLNAQIEEINRMMQENKEKVEQLTKKIKGSNASAAKFQKMVKSLQEQLTQKEQELALLNEKYETIKVQPVDMFPHTQHVESVAQLKLRSLL